MRIYRIDKDKLERNRRLARAGLGALIKQGEDESCCPKCGNTFYNKKGGCHS